MLRCWNSIIYLYLYLYEHNDKKILQILGYKISPCSTNVWLSGVVVGLVLILFYLFIYFDVRWLGGWSRYSQGQRHPMPFTLIKNIIAGYVNHPLLWKSFFFEVSNCNLRASWYVKLISTLHWSSDFLLLNKWDRNSCSRSRKCQ